MHFFVNCDICNANVLCKLSRCYINRGNAVKILFFGINDEFPIIWAFYWDFFGYRPVTDPVTDPVTEFSNFPKI
jgi:hypothetical protein